MLTGGQFYDVLSAVVPLYVALFLGYGSLKWWGVVTPEQSVGISRLNAILAMPVLVFEIIAFNNPYTMNNRLIAAYCLANVVVLGVLGLWAMCTRTGSLDWVITLFQLSVMPNTIIVGIPVLSPLYAITSSGIATIFIGQVLWLFPVLFLYELRAAREQGRPVLGHGAQAPGDQDISVVTVKVKGAEDHQKNGIPALMTQAERGDACRIKIGEERIAKEGEQMSNGNSIGEMKNDPRYNHKDVEIHGAEVNVPSSMNPKEVASRVGMKMVQLPLTYAFILGILYSLIAGRWDFGPPQLLRNSLDIIGRITLGLTMYSIGLSMAGEKKLVTSWWVAFYGALCRYIVGPGAVGLAALLLGLRGDTLRFSILQAALPQAVICFVFAKDYDLHASIFSTAVSIQTVVFMPVIVLAYFYLLELYTTVQTPATFEMTRCDQAQINHDILSAMKVVHEDMHFSILNS